MCEKHLAHCPVQLSTLYVFMLTSKNSHNLKVERFYLVAIFRTSNPRDSISSNLERTASRRWGEEPGYIEALQQRAGSLNIKIINWNQISQEIECFSVCRKMQESGLTEASPIICTSAILGQYPCAFHILAPLELMVRSGCRPDGCRIAGTSSWEPLGLSPHWGTAATDVCDILVYWHSKRKTSHRF